jgi:hypothetical protein
MNRSDSPLRVCDPAPPDLLRGKLGFVHPLLPLRPAFSALAVRVLPSLCPVLFLAPRFRCKNCSVTVAPHSSLRRCGPPVVVGLSSCRIAFCNPFASSLLPASVCRVFCQVKHGGHRGTRLHGPKITLSLKTPHPVWVAKHGKVGKPGASGSAEGPHKRRSERVLQQ